MRISISKKLLTLGVYSLLTISLFECSSNLNHKKVTNEAHKHYHTMDMENKTITLDSDFPIFKPSHRTYAHYLKMNDVEDIYLRHNTSLKNKSRLLAFYKENLEYNGWRINKAKSTDLKMVSKKGKRYATIRIFEIKQGDSSSLAFSINLLRPIDIEKGSKMGTLDYDSEIYKRNHRSKPISCL